MRVGTILGRLMELRDYHELAEIVQRTLSEHGWRTVVEELRWKKDEPEIVEGWELNLRPGVLRDGMIKILGLEGFSGLDVDLLEAFRDLNATNIEELRTLAKQKSMKLLKLEEITKLDIKS